MMDRPPIPVCEPYLTPGDAQAVKKCVESGWISGISPIVKEFETAFAEYIGTKYAVACNSGTTGLQLALAALKVGSGHQVIMPSFTMVATANAAQYLGARPLLVDSDADTWCMRRDLHDSLAMASTKVLMPVHIYGHPSHMKEHLEYAEKHGLAIVEDAAEAHGASIRRLGACGSIGDAGVFSFYANKIMTTGEGGMVTTNREDLDERLRWLRAHCFGRRSHFYHEELGYGYRMSGMQAALGLSQLRHIQDAIARRRRVAQGYTNILKDCPYLKLPCEQEGCKNVYWMYSVVLLRPELPNTRRMNVVAALTKAGIETRPMFTPMHNQPIYQYLHYKSGNFPVAEWLGMNGINLPSGPRLTSEDTEYVATTLLDAVGWKK